ncbi:MAG: L-threonylcarbamoyladenylate synthase [Nitrospira sp.]
MATIESCVTGDLAGLCDRLLRVRQRGGVIAFPTETYYALSVDPFNEEAVARVQRIKGRPDGKPLLILIGERAQLHELVVEVPVVAQVLMDAFWPGALTIVLPANPRFPFGVTAGTGTVGVRQSSWPALGPILSRIGPVTGTSANLSGEPPMQTAQDVQRTLGDQVDLILDTGSTPGGLPSTLVTVCGVPMVLREGPVSRSAMEQALAERGIHLKMEEI